MLFVWETILKGGIDSRPLLESPEAGAKACSFPACELAMVSATLKMRPELICLQGVYLGSDYRSEGWGVGRAGGGLGTIRVHPWAAGTPFL